MFGAKYSESAKSKISTVFKGENNHRYDVVVSEKSKSFILVSMSKGVI